MEDIDLGKAVRKRRIERGLKVYELARRVGINPVYITQIEKHGKLPSIPVMEAISDVLGDIDLFNSYIYIKYPMIFAKEKQRQKYLDIEMKEIFREMDKKNKTPQERKKIEMRIKNFLGTILFKEPVDKKNISWEK
jgi:transcriptional regulator with XRE-family HTH domain